MTDRIDDILKDKLYDGEPVADFSGFDRIEESLLAAEQKEKRRRRGALILLFGKYAAVVVVVLALSFLTYMMNRPSGSGVVVSEAVVETPVESDEGETDVPEIRGTEQDGSIGAVAGADYLSGTETESVGVIAGADNKMGSSKESLPGLGSEVLITDEQTGRENNQYISGPENESIVPSEQRTAFGFFEPTEPGQIVLAQFSPTGIITPDSALYDLDEYLAEFDNLYGEETDEDKSKWHPIIMADAFAITKADELNRSFGIWGISAYKYIGNSYDEESGLVNKYDQILIDRFHDEIGSVASGADYYKFVNLFPVSFSLGVSRDIGTRIGIETGLQYSYLKSINGIQKWTSLYFDQRIHYIGVPITLYYSLLPENSKWDIDLRGGVTAEKALSAIGTTKFYKDFIVIATTVNDEVPSNIMLSGHAGMGFGYSLFKNIGIYLAPEFEYYFYTKGQPLSYKTDNPFRFNIKAGLKFDF